MTILDAIYDKLFAPAPEDPCRSCDKLREGTYDATANHKKLQEIQSTIPDATSSAKGQLYTDMAEIYLRNAVRHADNGNPLGTRLLTEGTDQGRATLDKYGNRRGYDGAIDALGRAAENGGDPDRIKDLSTNARQLNDWSRRHTFPTAKRPF